MQNIELRRFPIALLILLLVFSSAAFADDETEGYRNDEIGFNLDIPSNWFVLDGGTKDGVIIASNPDFKDARTDTGAAIGIILVNDLRETTNESQQSTGDPRKGIDPQKLWHETVDGMDEDVSGPEPIMFGKVEGLRGSFANAEDDFSAIIYLCSGFGKAYMVLAVIHPSSELEERYRPILDKMVETLVFFP